MCRCESVKKLCTCVKHFQRFQLKANVLFFCFNIVLDDYDILLSQSYIWWWRPLNRRLLYVKNNMFHDTWLCIILWLCCCTCQWVATWHGQTALTEEDILYLCIRLYFELNLKNQTEDSWHPSHTHLAFMHTSNDTNKVLRLHHSHINMHSDKHTKPEKKN